MFMIKCTDDAIHLPVKVEMNHSSIPKFLNTFAIIQNMEELTFERKLKT